MSADRPLPPTAAGRRVAAVAVVLFAAVAAGQPEAAAAAGEAMIRRHGERTRPAPEPLLGAPRAA